MTTRRGTEWIWATIVIVLTVSLIAWDSLSLTLQRRAETVERLTALSRVAEARLSQTLGSIDALLQDAGHELDKYPLPGDPEFHRFLITRAKFEPSTLTITIVDPKDGVILHSTNPQLVGRNVGQRSYLDYFRAHPDSTSMFVTEPVISLLDRQVIFTARALHNSQGQIAAILVSALKPSIFSDAVEAIRPSEPSGAISITNFNHVVLARAPAMDSAAVGKSLSHAPLRRAHLESGLDFSIQEGSGAFDGNARLIAFRSVEPWGIIIGVSATRADIYAPILSRIIANGGVAVLVMIFAIVLVKVRVSGEQTRRQAEQQVVRARDYYMQVLDEMPTLVRRQDQNGHCQYVNATWAAFTGRSVASAQEDGWLDAVHPDDRAALLKGGEHEYRLIRSDGGYAWIHEVSRPLRDPDGQPAGSLASGIDITESRQFQEQLQQSNAELEQFAYVASHDMREPLRMINSYIGLIERRLGAQLEGDVKDFIAFARDGAQRMDRLIQDLLQYSRIGRMSAPRSMVNLNECLDQARSLLDLAMAEQGAVLVASPLPTVFASADDMVRLFQNLIANAIKYRRPDEAPRIEIAAHRQTGAWCISISDNGIGISREFFDRIFRIFQRLHARDEHGGGSGIGLSICKKIVESHGGRIWVDSAGPNQGSVFSFTLPA